MVRDISLALTKSCLVNIQCEDTGINQQFGYGICNGPSHSDSASLHCMLDEYVQQFALLPNLKFAALHAVE